SGGDVLGVTGGDGQHRGAVHQGRDGTGGVDVLGQAGVNKEARTVGAGDVDETAKDIEGLVGAGDEGNGGGIGGEGDRAGGHGGILRGGGEHGDVGAGDGVHMETFADGDLLVGGGGLGGEVGTVGGTDDGG